MRDAATKIETKMIEQIHTSTRPRNGWLAVVFLAMLGLICSSSFYAFGSDKDKKKKDQPQEQKSVLDMIDKSKIVWPQPPNIARVKYMDYFAGEKLPDFNAQAAKNKSSWMDRLAGTSAEKGDNSMKNHFFFGEPQVVRHLDHDDTVEDRFVGMVGFEFLPLGFVGMRDDYRIDVHHAVATRSRRHRRRSCRAKNCMSRS